jgi:5-methylcytosine-specific restriction protein B
MKPSDEIREHVIRKHIEPARMAGGKELTLRAGDIHKELGYSGRMPAVCSVLGSNRLEREGRVKRTRREGPQNGANAIFVYSIE